MEPVLRDAVGLSVEHWECEEGTAGEKESMSTESASAMETRNLGWYRALVRDRTGQRRCVSCLYLSGPVAAGQNVHQR